MSRGLLKVLVIYPVPYGEDGLVGGGERYALELSRALSKRVQTRFVSFSENERARRDHDLDIRIERARGYIRGNRLNPINLRFLRHVGWAEVVHCVGWNCLVLELAIVTARLLGRKVFVTDIGGGAMPLLGRLLPMKKLVTAYLMIGAPGQTPFDEFRSKWRIVGSGVDLAQYTIGPRPCRDGVLYVGRLLPHKGIDYLIDAVGEDLHLTIVGRKMSAQYFDLLTSRAAGKRVSFFTEWNDSQVRDAMRSARVLVLPSVQHTIFGGFAPLPEYHGLVLLEALASGTPVVCTDVGLMREVVDESCGRVVPPNDPAAIRAAIEEITSDPVRWSAMSEAARSRAGLWSWDAVAGRCVEAYRQ